LLDAWTTAFRGSLGGVSGARCEVADLLPVRLNGHIGSVLSRFHANDSFSGTTAKEMDTYFRANLLNWWTDSH